jgi:hypothetical protein
MDIGQTQLLNIYNLSASPSCVGLPPNVEYADVKAGEAEQQSV